MIDEERFKMTGNSLRAASAFGHVRFDQEAGITNRSTLLTPFRASSGRFATEDRDGSRSICLL
jgi:hypothetical protein